MAKINNMFGVGGLFLAIVGLLMLFGKTGVDLYLLFSHTFPIFFTLEIFWELRIIVGISFFIGGLKLFLDNEDSFTKKLMALGGLGLVADGILIGLSDYVYFAGTYGDPYGYSRFGYIILALVGVEFILYGLGIIKKVK